MIAYDAEGSIVGGGNNISVQGEEWVGVTQLHDGWWMARTRPTISRKHYFTFRRIDSGSIIFTGYGSP